MTYLCQQLKRLHSKNAYVQNKVAIALTMLKDDESFTQDMLNTVLEIVGGIFYLPGLGKEGAYCHFNLMQEVKGIGGYLLAKASLLVMERNIKLRKLHESEAQTVVGQISNMSRAEYSHNQGNRYHQKIDRTATLDFTTPERGWK